ncbi:DUF4235 domain-containing protein [uncultured Jatrophihabitans sp.]|uniref:DUF4235 domain-containing protein n=1 Tax=uncultured Jatrophihabitans sp. TaxID=1610747 RepID=UPI0035C9C98E
MAIGAKIGLKVINLAIGIPVGIATKKLVERTWTAVRPGDPPRKAKDVDSTWSDALTWAVLSAAGIVAAEFITRQGTAVAYRSITGLEPPPPKPSKATKKLAGASEKSKVTDD